MRTSFDIPEGLFRALKARAADEGIPMREILLRALQAHLGGPSAASRYEFRWRSEGGGMLVPEAVLNSTAALHELLDGLE